MDWDEDAARWHELGFMVALGDDGDALAYSFRQLAFVGVMMGDIGAVSVIQEAHTRFLLHHGVLQGEALIPGPLGFPAGPEYKDVDI